MKKLYLLLSFIIIAGTAMQAQIYEDDFDSYNSGERLAEQAGLPWSTWSSTPGSAEDPYVSDEQSNSSPNSVKIVSGNDNVLLLGDSLTGRYLVSFYIYVPSGKLGYYNILQMFSGTDSQWGTQVYFDENGQGRIDAGSEGAATFTYNHDSWILVENYVDLDSDWAEVFIDGDFLVGWQWTLGTFGTPGPKQLGAVNFYGWDGSKKGTPEYYFDDIVFSSSPIGDAPQNLEAEVTGLDVNLTWDAPATGSVFTYYVFRNDVLLGIGPDLNYLDNLELPGTYNYSVKAMYLESGLSAPAGPVEVIIEGGTDRQLVLVEIGTGTGCPYCPGSAMGADELIGNGHDVAIIEYHSYNDSDPYNTPEAAERTSYYNITAYPTAVFDGGNDVVGGNATQSMYPSYSPIADNGITKPAWFEVDLDVTTTNGTDFDIIITATKIYDIAGTNMSVHLVLTESDIEYSWMGMSKLDFVCRKMYPGSNGTPTDFTLDVPVEIDFGINVPYEVNNCELVAFVQNMDSKEIMQTEKVDLGKVVGISELGEKYTNIYPNPATSIVNIESASSMKHISLLSLNGQKIYEVALDQNKVELNIDFLERGVYIINIDTENGTNVEKLTIF
jgi:type IX secretion system substrate protein/outer membrane protein Omp28